MRLGYSLGIRPKMCQVLLKSGRETASVPDFGDAGWRCSSGMQGAGRCTGMNVYIKMKIERKKTMKKVFALLLAAVFVLSALTVYGSSNPSDETAGNESVDAASDAEQNNHSEPQDTNYVFGTATLTYAEFYSGDVSSADGYDAVSSATTSKYGIMPNMSTDFVDEETNTDGYHILGVKNVNVAVPESELGSYKAINPTFTESDAEPEQYKTVSISDGKAVYGATEWNVADTVTDATAELVTGSNWGDYQINVTDGAAVHLRNTREDEGFDVGSDILGIILETESGLKVGMEHLQSIWVQPYEVSWNIPEDNSHNSHIAAFDNLAELGKLTGETVTKITYITPDAAYVYEFEGIYIKPLYSGEISGTVNDAYDEITLSADDFKDFENGKLTVTYTLGAGRSREITVLLETDLVNGTATYSLDTSPLTELAAGGVYAAVISSDSYADVTIVLPASDDQIAALNAVLAAAREKLAAAPDNDVLSSHIVEAEALLSESVPSSQEVGSLTNELTQLISDEQQQGEHGSGEHGGH